MYFLCRSTDDKATFPRLLQMYRNVRVDGERFFCLNYIQYQLNEEEFYKQAEKAYAIVHTGLVSWTLDDDTYVCFIIVWMQDVSVCM